MMKLLDLKTGKETTLTEYDTLSCAVGNFDGVHLGHQALIALAAAKKNGSTKSAVWTFSEPSAKYLGKAPLLTSLEERLEQFHRLGIELVFLADFDAIRDISAEDFAKKILFDTCHVREVFCGFNFRYGKNALGNATTLQNTFALLGASATIMPPFSLNGETISSTEIRAALATGNTLKAIEYLGRPYSIETKITAGKKLGRTLGFPTANQPFPEGRAVPHFGVYAVQCEVDDQIHIGVANVGVRPTVENTNAINCETYLLDFDGDLYGKTMKTSFYRFLRPEMKFESTKALQKAVEQNIAQTRAYFDLETECKL